MTARTTLGARCIAGIVLLLTCMGAGASSATGTTALEDHLYFVGENYPTSWIGHMDLSTNTADVVIGPDPGTNWVGASQLAVSPDGQAIVFGSHWSGFPSYIAVVNTDGTGYERLMPFDYDDGYFRFPKFAPDNKHVIINRQDQLDGEDDIYLLDRASRAEAGDPDVEPLIDWDGDQYDGVFSPDGSTLYFASNTEPNGDPLDGFTIYAADADGSDPVPVAGLSGMVDVWGLQVSPGGSRLTFGGLSDWSGEYDVYSIGTNGLNLEQVTDTPLVREFYPVWSPDGQRIAFIRGEGANGGVVADADGTDEQAAPGTWPTFRQPSAFIDLGDIQAAKFRPHWQFDDSEHWRPLNMDMFMAERDPAAPSDAFHMMCDGLGCDSTPLLAASDVEGWSNAWLDIGSIGGQDPDDYYSPRAGCSIGGLRDCDGGDKSTPNFNASAVYYNVTDSPGAYRYIDYWAFYRYNDLSVDEHEGDWEGATVVPSLSNPEAIDAVAMAQHTSVIWYLPGSLTCDNGGSGSCEPGKRPWVYVASGSHAGYASACENQVFPPQVCLTPANLPEGDHKGDAPWGRNNDDPGSGALLELPSSGAGDWVDWAGRWGNACAPMFQCYFPSPSSPGTQHRYQCPWDGYEQELCPGGSQQRSSSPHTDRATSAQACGNWIAPDLAATACSPSLLRSAIAGGTLGQAGSFELARRDAHAPSSSARGVAQLGGNLLSEGDRLWMAGSAPSDTQLVVRAIGRKLVYEARFDNLGLSSGGKVRVDVRSRGGRLVFAGRTAQGRIEPVELRTEKIAP